MNTIGLYSLCIIFLNFLSGTFIFANPIGDGSGCEAHLTAANYLNLNPNHVYNTLQVDLVSGRAVVGMPVEKSKLTVAPVTLNRAVYNANNPRLTWISSNFYPRDDFSPSLKNLVLNDGRVEELRSQQLLFVSPNMTSYSQFDEGNLILNNGNSFPTQIKSISDWQLKRAGQRAFGVATGALKLIYGEEGTLSEIVHYLVSTNPEVQLNFEEDAEQVMEANRAHLRHADGKSTLILHSPFGDTLFNNTTGVVATVTKKTNKIKLGLQIPGYIDPKKEPELAKAVKRAIQYKELFREAISHTSEAEKEKILDELKSNPEISTALEEADFHSQNIDSLFRNILNNSQSTNIEIGAFLNILEIAVKEVKKIVQDREFFTQTSLIYSLNYPKISDLGSVDFISHFNIDTRDENHEPTKSIYTTNLNFKLINKLDSRRWRIKVDYRRVADIANPTTINWPEISIEQSVDIVMGYPIDKPDQLHILGFIKTNNSGAEVLVTDSTEINIFMNHFKSLGFLKTLTKDYPFGWPVFIPEDSLFSTGKIKMLYFVSFIEALFTGKLRLNLIYPTIQPSLNKLEALIQNNSQSTNSDEVLSRRMYAFNESFLIADIENVFSTKDEKILMQNQILKFIMGTNELLSDNQVQLALNWLSLQFPKITVLLANGTETIKLVEGLTALYGDKVNVIPRSPTAN
jgi:hypothetical protein